MRMSLTALGWILDPPQGNRLRWSVPAAEKGDGDSYIGLPNRVIVERAFLDKEAPTRQGKNGSIVGPMAPLSWWDYLGDIAAAGYLPGIINLSTPVQAARFIYRGAPARLRAFYSKTDELVAQRMIADGDRVELQASQIDRMEVTAFPATFADLATLDLHRDYKLPWKTIATIAVAPSANFTLHEAATRYDMPPTLSLQEWTEFTTLAREAQAARPSEEVASEPTIWQAFDTMAALRWEHALLFGLGFFDGPRTTLSSVDKIAENQLLKAPPHVAVAYRVRDADERLKPSNVIICPPWSAAPLSAPERPNHEHAEVKLAINPDSGQKVFAASYTIRWRQSDPQAIGVVVEEETSSSPATGAPAENETYECRTRFASDPPMEGALARSRYVAFHDVRIRCRARASDGWDRLSAFSPLTPWHALHLDHAPPAPTFLSARFDSGVVNLERQVGVPGLPDWAPDPVIAADPTARVCIYRRNPGVLGKPARVNATVDLPIPVQGTRCQSAITGGAPLSRFVNGSLIAPPFKATIREINGSSVLYDFEDGARAQLQAGPATLLQDPMHPDLWIKVAEFDPNALGQHLSFSDPIPDPVGGSDVLSYHARLSFLGGRIGPNSNTVQAFRVMPVPDPPPPFDVETLGIDFYNRTMVKIRFTTPAADGRYTVWWAAGALTASDFDGKGVPGEMRAQQPFQNRFLFDVLALPLPRSGDRTVTIGVQCVDDAEGQSPFETVQITLPA